MATSHAAVGLQLASARDHVTTPIRVTTVEKRTPRAIRKPLQSESAPQRVALVTTERLRTLPRRPSWVTTAAAVAAVAGLTWWIMAQRAPDIDPRNLIAFNLNAAQQAISAGRYFDPPGSSAVHYYGTVLALDPANAEATSGIDRIADVFLANAKAFIVDGRIADAVIALEDVRRLRPGHRRLALIEAQLRKEMDRQVFLNTPEPEAAPLQPVRRREGSSAPAKAKTNSEIGTGPAMTAARHDTPAQVDASASVPAPRDATNSIANEAEALAAGIAPSLASGSAGDASGSAVGDPATIPDTMNASSTNPPAPPVAISGDAGAVAGSSLAPAESAPTAASASAAPPAQRALVKYIAPEYPREALLRGIEGWIDMSLYVTPGGDVLDPRVSDGKGRQLFDRAALAAVRQWKYEPRPGQEAAQAMQVRVSFKLE
jgi:TonB family protein